ncbi:MAG: tail fiber domain-containing protein [Bacteroidota bacterium]
MKNQFLLTISVLVLFCVHSYSQSAAVSADGLPAHNSAMLDVRNPNKGLLIPRVALTGTADAATIPSPAVSLLVYNTTPAGAGGTAVIAGFYYWNGTAWSLLNQGTGSGSGWSLSGNAGTTDNTNFIGTTDNKPLNIRVNNEKAGRIDHIVGNTFFGFQAGNVNTSGSALAANGHLALSSNTTGIGNTATGYYALRYNTTGAYNTANGTGALQTNTTGSGNTAIGLGTLQLNTTGYWNTATGQQALSANTTGIQNTAVGFYSLLFNTTGNNNTAIGLASLKFNTTGSDNTATGFDALNANTTGKYNTATGFSSLKVNTIGDGNTASGYNALMLNEIGGYNTANGLGALQTNTAGNANTASGVQALVYNTTGSNNTANGMTAMYQNTTGSYNTATGVGALAGNTTGEFNIGIGISALSANLTGSNNTAIGFQANVSSDNLSNSTAIGNGAIVNASNKVRIGNTAVTVIEGQVAYSFPSDKRFKYNIKSNVPGLDFINKLTPVTYYFNTEKLAAFTSTGVLENNSIYNVAYKGEKQLHTGFLAQDVEKIAKDLGYEFDGVHAPSGSRDHYSLAYSQFIMPLVKSVQEQQVIIESQKSDIDQLKEQVQMLIKTVETLKHK